MKSTPRTPKLLHKNIWRCWYLVLPILVFYGRYWWCLNLENFYVPSAPFWTYMINFHNLFIYPFAFYLIIADKRGMICKMDTTSVSKEGVSTFSVYYWTFLTIKQWNFRSFKKKVSKSVENIQIFRP